MYVMNILKAVIVDCNYIAQWRPVILSNNCIYQWTLSKSKRIEKKIEDRITIVWYRFQMKSTVIRSSTIQEIRIKLTLTIYLIHQILVISTKYSYKINLKTKRNGKKWF